MASLDELEASLRANWDRDTLAVYADELQNQGELRGELIVIDLRIEDAGPVPELVARRKELLAQWLATLPPGKVQHGFLDLDATGPDPVEQIRAGLASPASRYIRTVAIAGTPRMLREALDHLVVEPRAGIVRLALRQWSSGADYTLGPAATKSLFENLPDLEALELDGYRICSDHVHPKVRRMRVSGITASASLLDLPGAPWAALEELDFAFASHIDGEHPMARALHASRFPALAVLDLSRNKPGWLEPDTLGADVDLAAFVAGLAFRRRLREIRLPPVAEPKRSSKRRRS